METLSIFTVLFGVAWLMAGGGLTVSVLSTKLSRAEYALRFCAIVAVVLVRAMGR